MRRGIRRAAGTVALSFAAAFAYTAKPQAKVLSVKLDRIDIRILHELQKNGRITNV